MKNLIKNILITLAIILILTVAIVSIIENNHESEPVPAKNFTIEAGDSTIPGVFNITSQEEVK